MLVAKISRLPHLADQLPICNLLFKGAFNSRAKVVAIIRKQVERLDTDVCSIDAPLDQTPEILKSIGMNLAINIRYSRVNNLTLEFVQAFVGFQRIAV